MNKSFLVCTYTMLFLSRTSATWSTLAPDDISSLTVSVWPFLAATMSAVSPFYMDIVIGAMEYD